MEEKKKKTAAQQRATAKWESENYEKILLRVPKGTKEKLNATGESLNGFINKAILERLDQISTDPDTKTE
ncbi:MAG: hypothetical protein J6S85_10340 [Methanobrevibacter sp.]|nr:hypothetical protein [Methanobrevibacter sp.]